VCVGGNTELVGFKTRVARDLRDLLPEYSTVVDVKTCTGPSRWSVAMGSSSIKLPFGGKQGTGEMCIRWIHEAQFY
jgi:actin-related protein